MTRKKKINKGKLFRRSILLLLILGATGFYFANRYVKNYGFNGLGEFVSNYNHNRHLADNVEPENVEIIISDKDYQFIVDKRQESLDRGLQVNEGDNYVSCKYVYHGDTTKGEMRLKGHMTDHLEGDKWSFRVKLEDEVMGMYRFSLQHPGTRNYAYEWVYHELLKNEDVIALQYKFVNFTFNGKDLGIYAVEEHFGQHVLTNNNRPKGAVLRWNPNLFWEYRIDEFEGLYLDEQFSNYASAYAEPYDKGHVFKDSSLIQTYLKGAENLELFRRGAKSTSEVFDIDKMANFHAIIDLVGGYSSLDWSDVKFYFNSESGLIEPVGYESFSIQKTERIAGQRIPDRYEGESMNYHDRLFSDIIFFKAYIKALERICDEVYFNDFINIIQSDLDENLGVLAHEWPYLKFSFDGYFENIELIRHNLLLPKAFHCFKEGMNDSIINLSFTPVSDFPIEIISVVIDDKKEFMLDSTFVLAPRPRNSFAKYFYLNFKYEKNKVDKLKVKARIPGSSNVFEIEVIDFPSYSKVEKNQVNENYKSHEQLVLLQDSSLFFNTKEILIDSPILIEKGQTLRILPGQRMTIIEEGQLVVKGRIEFYGEQDENEIFLESRSEEVAIILDHAELMCNNVSILSSKKLFFLAYDSKLIFENTYVSDVESELIQALSSDITLLNVMTGNLESLGSFDRCSLKMKNVSAKKGKSFLNSFGSTVYMLSCNVEGFKMALNLDNSSQLYTWVSGFEDNDTIVGLNNSSVFSAYGGRIENANLGFSVDLNSNLSGVSSYSLFGTKIESIDQKEKRNE